MKRPPRSPKTPIMTFPLILRTGLVSAMMLAGAFGLLVWEQAAHAASVAEAQTIAVNVICELNYPFHRSILVDS